MNAMVDFCGEFTVWSDLVEDICNVSGAYLISSTGISSHPGDFPGFSLDTAFLTSAIVNGILIGVGCNFSIGSAFL